MKLLTALSMAGIAAVGLASAPALAQDAPAPVTDEMLANPPAGDWLLWRRTQNHWGYSPLDQINRDNVAGLTLVWTRGMNAGNQESTPLVHDGVMYLPNPGGVVQALDAATGQLIWEYRRQFPEDISEFVVLNDITRNIGLYEDKVIYITADSNLVALNAGTGAVEYETQIADYREGNLQTSGPMIGNGKIFSGRSCTPRGGPDTCFLVAHDAASGEELWRTHTIPRPGEPGDETWSGVPYETRNHVGSWITPSYDPELNMVYFGTSVTNPYAKFAMGSEDPDAEHLYQTSTLALDADTGEIVWYQQHIRDQWDLDHPFERILVDTAIAPNADEVDWINPDVVPGTEYKVLTGVPGKTGIFYSIDRETGEFLWARNTIHQNVVLDIDPSNGRATMNSELFYTEVGQSVEVCPAAGGGKDWPAGAYSPLTNAIYYPMQNQCMDATLTISEPGDNAGLDFASKLAPGTENLGTVRGISVETGEEIWLREQRAGTTSLMTTGGGLLFGGDMAGRFRALDQETGEVLWEIGLGSPIGGFPITYEVDGRQYVAVPIGNMLIGGGYLARTPEIRPSTVNNNIFVFALPESM